MSDATSPTPAGPVVLLAGDCDSTRAIYHALAHETPFARVILESSIPRTQLLRRRAKKLGVRAAASQAAFAAIAVPILRAASRRRLEALRGRLSADKPVPEDLIERVPSVNAPECIAALRALAPAVVVLSGTRIVSREVLQSVLATFINVHAGITPRYRGTHGAYWAYADGRPASAGVTVHLVDPGIDTGGILAQALIARGREDTFVTLPYLQLEAGLPLLVTAVREALAGRVRVVPSLDASASVLCHHPGLVEYVRNLVSTGAR
jgi:folate-dependent phosphoribosylglycinamide formyltransferase PurN